MTSNSVTCSAFTICARNYFAQALLLRESFMRQHPDHAFYVVLMDRVDAEFAAGYPDVRILWVEEINLPHFSAHSLRFDIIEFSTNVKAHCLLTFLEQHQRVLYLDPDTYLFNDLNPVYDELERSNIVVTPATTTPVRDGHRPDDIEFLRVGVFNLGFIGVAATDESRRFLRWWSDRCLAEGFHETQSGLFVDQKWVNLAPCYFQGVCILKDPGVNMAPWNLHERQLSHIEGTYWVNGEVPLRLFHFSSFDPNHPQTIAKRQTRFVEGERRDLTQLLDGYARELLAADYAGFSQLEYSFDYFPGGEYISPTLRRLYANPVYAFPLTEDPAAPGSALMKFARARGLVGPKVGKAKRVTAGDVSRYSLQIKVLGTMFKLLLKLFGPNRYFILMRYLAHASSIRNQPPL